MAQETIDVVQDLCDHFESRVRVYSGCRCEAYNKKIGGAKASQHTKGTAMDIGIITVTPKEVQEYLLEKYKGKYGIGRYHSFTHIDTRTQEARWSEL